MDFFNSNFDEFKNASEVLHSLWTDGTCPLHPGQALKMFCRDDRSLMCWSCSNQHLGHEILAFETMEEGTELVKKALTTLNCKSHPNNEAVLFCSSDDTPICRNCAEGSCRKHSLTPIADLYSKYQDEFHEICSRMENLLDNNPDLSQSDFSQNHYSEGLRERQQKCIEDVEKTYDSYIQKVLQEKTEVIQEINLRFSEIEAEMETTRSRYAKLHQWPKFQQAMRSASKSELISFGLSQQLSNLTNYITSLKQDHLTPSLLQGQFPPSTLQVIFQPQHHNPFPIFKPFIPSPNTSYNLPPPILYKPVQNYQNLAKIGCLSGKIGNEMIDLTNELGVVSGVVVGKRGEIYCFIMSSRLSESYLCCFDGEKDFLDYAVKVFDQDVSAPVMAFVDDSRILITGGNYKDGGQNYGGCALVDLNSRRVMNLPSFDPDVFKRVIAVRQYPVGSLVFIETIYSGEGKMVWIFNCGVEDVEFPINKWSNVKFKEFDVQNYDFEPGNFATFLDDKRVLVMIGNQKGEEFNLETKTVKTVQLDQVLPWNYRILTEYGGNLFLCADSSQKSVFHLDKTSLNVTEIPVEFPVLNDNRSFWQKFWEP